MEDHQQMYVTTAKEMLLICLVSSDAAARQPSTETWCFSNPGQSGTAAMSCLVGGSFLQTGRLAMAAFSAADHIVRLAEKYIILI